MVCVYEVYRTVTAEKHYCHYFKEHENVSNDCFQTILILCCGETKEGYSLELKKLAMTILSQMAKALKMEAEGIRLKRHVQ